MGKSLSSLGSLNGVAKSDLNPICGRICCSHTKHSSEHILTFKYQNQAVQKLEFIYISRATTFMKGSMIENIVFNTKTLMQVGGRVLFPNIIENR